MIRFGVLVPATNTTVEPEMYRMVPEGVTIHFSRIRFSPPAPSSPEIEGRGPKIKRSLDEMAKNAPEAAKAFTVIQPKLDVIGFACNSGSFFGGVDFEKGLVQKIQAVTGIPSISTSGAAVEALKELDVKKVAMISPYTEYQNGRALAFLQANGFEVVAYKGLGASVLDHNELLPDVSYGLAAAIAKEAKFDAIYSCCTAFRTIEILERVEAETGKPMVSANLATFWFMLRKAGVKKNISGCGTLLKHL